MIAIDLGSNTIRCITYDCEKKEWGKEYETVVRTAENLHVEKKIGENAVKRVVNALKEADAMLDFSKHEVCGVTTEAMRQAQNAEEVLETIKRQTGVGFRIISGEEEATYTANAVKARLDILQHPANSFALVDIGGGSTEIIFLYGKKLVSQSFPIGIVTLTESGDVENNLCKLLVPVKEYINQQYKVYGKPEIYVQTAGTPTTIAAFLQGMNYKTYDSSKINGYELDVAGCEKTLQELLAMDENERSFYVGVGREELIISGILITKKLYELLEFESAIVIDDGLREGLALACCRQEA